MTTLASKRAALFGQSEDIVTVAWRAAVQTEGGTVTPAYSDALTRFLRSLRIAGILERLDDMGMMRCENSYQATVSLLQRRTGTNQGAIFVPFTGWSTDGTSTYFDTGFIPITHCTVATTTDQMFGTWETQDVSSATYSIGGGAIGGGSTGAAWLIPRTGGNIVQAKMSSADRNGPAITDSRRLTTVDRDGTTMYFYKNGVQGGTNTADTTDGLPNGTQYIGCRNNNGTAQNFRANVFSFWVYGRLLTAAQHLALYNALVAFYAAIQPADIYADSATGSNSNPGTEALPILGPNRGLAIAIPRARIHLAGATASPTTYTLTTQVNITQWVTLMAREPLGAILAGTGTGQVLTHTPTNGEPLELRDLIIDPSVNASGPGQSGIQLASVATPYSFTMRDCLVQNWTTLYGLFGASSTRSNVRLFNTDFVSDPAIATSSAILLSSMAAGSVSIEGGTTTIAKLQGGGNYGINISRTVAGIDVSVVDHTADVTPDAGASGQVYVLYVKGPATIQGGSYSMNNGGTASAAVVGVDLGGGSLPISGSRILDVTAYSDAEGGGLGIYANLDTVSDPDDADDILISGCSFTGGANFVAANGHGFFMCFLKNSLGTLNYCESAGYNYILKGTRDSWWTNVVGKNASTANALVKGCTGGGYSGGTFTAESGWTPSSGMVNVLANGATNSTGIQINGAEFIVDGATNVKFAVVDADQDVSFSGNTYRVSSGSAAALPFTWLGVAVSKAYWLANVEPDATCIGF